MSFLSALLSGIEQLSENPTTTPENQPTQPTLTPGGLDPSNNIPTLGKMQAGSLTYKLVALIEGVKYPLSDAPQASVQAALRDVSGGDWASATVLPGLFVDLRVSQSIDPDDPFPKMGSIQIKVLDTDHTDVFGTFVHKRNTGATARITSTVTRSATTLNVANTSGFASSGTAYLGAECFSYTGVTASSFTGVTRGKYSPFGGARGSHLWADSTAGSRFASYQRTATDIYHTQNNPLVSEVPRVWIGKRVGIWLHTWDETTQQLNTHENAQLVYAGRLVTISDDPDTMCTTLEVEHISADMRNATVFRDPFAATVAKGVYIPAGRYFSFSDGYGSAAGMKSANNLTVVSGTPANPSEMKAGRYTCHELCSIISGWLAYELNAGRIYGSYNWQSPVSTNDGPRTKVHWAIAAAGALVPVFWTAIFPGEVAAQLGIFDTDPDSAGQSAGWPQAGVGPGGKIAQGKRAPFDTLIFKPGGPGRIADSSSLATSYEIENQRGTFFNQYSYLPASVKNACDSTLQWGLFLLNDKVLMVGAYDSATYTLKNCSLAPFQLTADNAADSSVYFGNRVDEPEIGDVTIRQILMLEGPFRSVMNMLIYSCGTSGYNHAAYDLLSYGMGLGMPGELFGDSWERSLANLPGAESPIVVILDEPTKFADLIRDDLRLRRASIRWKDEHFEVVQWRTPLSANATVDLTEANKAAPAGTQDNHRIASQETDQWYYPVVKFDYARDFAVGRNGQYLKSIQAEDITATDEASSGRTLTLKLRNTYGAFQNTGAGIEELIKEYIPGMPLFSKPARMVVRSIDHRYFEGVAPGDIATITDGFMRDPISGTRGTTSRAAFITKLTYDIGGVQPDGSVRDAVGEVELFFLDVHRGSQYAPAADVDWEANYAGFSAGYRSSDKVLRCKPHQYSYVQQISTLKGKTNVGEPVDASWFEVGDKITVIERDPSDPTTYTSWNDTVAAVSGDDLTLTTGLGGWSATKRYRVIYQAYASCQASQQDYVFQADDADELIQNAADAYQFAIDEEPYTFRPTNTNTDKAELVPTLAYGDGKPMDVGMDRALVNTINSYIDYKSAHQCVVLSSEYPQTFAAGGTNDTWTTLFYYPIFLGTEHLSSSITRTLKIRPIIRSETGSNAWLRVSLCRQSPIAPPDVNDNAYVDPVLVAEFSRTSEWGPITSTTWQLGAETTLNVGVKDLHFGYAWVLVEGAGDMACRGLGKCLEGPRTVT